MTDTVLANALEALREAGLAADPRTLALARRLARPGDLAPVSGQFVTCRLWVEREFDYADIVMQVDEIPAPNPPLLLVRRIGGHEKAGSPRGEPA